MSDVNIVLQKKRQFELEIEQLNCSISEHEEVIQLMGNHIFDGAIIN